MRAVGQTAHHERSGDDVRRRGTDHHARSASASISRGPCPGTCSSSACSSRSRRRTARTASSGSGSSSTTPTRARRWPTTYNGALEDYAKQSTAPPVDHTLPANQRLFESVDHLKAHFHEVPVLRGAGDPRPARRQRRSRSRPTSGARCCPRCGASCSRCGPGASGAAGRPRTCSTRRRWPTCSASPTPSTPRPACSRWRTPSAPTSSPAPAPDLRGPHPLEPLVSRRARQSNQSHW